jgi:uncharacterized protein involved in exopolysaccharide biosynthesis
MEDEIDLLQLFGVLWRHKWLIIGITGIAAVGVVVYSLFTLSLPPDRNPMPNVYQASALILVNEESSGGISAALASSGLGGLASAAGVSGGGGYGQLALKLLKSRTTLDTVADRFDITQRYEIKENPVGNTRNAILSHASFEFDAETKTLTISYEEHDPEFARDVVNGFVEVLEERFASIGVNRNIHKKELLEEKITEVKSKVDQLAQEIQSFQSKYGTLDVQTLAQEQISITAQLRSQLILKEMEIQTYRNFSSIEDPVIRRLEAERKNLSQLLKEMESGYSQYQDVLPAQDDLPELAYEFSILKRELNVSEQVYTSLRQQYEIARLNTEGQEPTFQVLEMAEAPDIKSGPSRATLCIVVTMAAFFLSIMGAFLLNAWRNIRSDPDAMRRLKGEK